MTTDPATSEPSGETPRTGKRVPRGYVRGCRAAAGYLDIDRKTFRSWRDDVAIPEHLRRLLKPRIIRGESYYRLADLDRFMAPVNNIPHDELTFRGSN